MRADDAPRWKKLISRRDHPDEDALVSILVEGQSEHAGGAVVAGTKPVARVH